MCIYICNVRTFRLLRDISINELARRIGVNRATLSRIECNKQNCSLALAFSLSKELNYPIEVLFSPFYD